MLEALGTAAMNACDIRPGHSVLDVGCGSGTSAIEIARRVGGGGRVLGIDISTPMLDVGRARLSALEFNNVTFENKDVAIYPFDKASFDRVFSRFGVMFFVDPVSAFTSIRSGLKSGGRLAFVCWQAANKNPWIAVPLQVVLQNVPAPPPADPEAPGPMAFSNPDRVRNILSEAGFSEIKIDALETLIPLEPDVPGSVQKLLEVGPVSRLLSGASDDVMERLKNELSDAIAGFQTDHCVMMGSATWIVSAISN
jgi:SAM-dependent methyltransferase